MRKRHYYSITKNEGNLDPNLSWGNRGKDRIRGACGYKIGYHYSTRPLYSTTPLLVKNSLYPHEGELVPLYEGWFLPTCLKCLKTDIFKDDMYTLEIGHDGNLRAYMEACKNDQ